MKNRTYFFWTRLESGEYVNIVYETKHRKGSWDHISDLLIKSNQSGVKTDQNRIVRGKRWKDTFDYIHILNKKNMYEECFDDYRTIDLR